MAVLIHSTVYPSRETPSTPITDIPLHEVTEYHPALVICAREGQRVRLKKLVAQLEKDGFKPGTRVVGWWELVEEYEGQAISALTPLFQQFPHVFFLSPERVHSRFRPTFDTMIRLARKLRASS